MLRLAAIAISEVGEQRARKLGFGLESCELRRSARRTAEHLATAELDGDCRCKLLVSKSDYGSTLTAAKTGVALQKVFISRTGRCIVEPMSTLKHAIAAGPWTLSIAFVLLQGCECHEQAGLCPPDTFATRVEGRTLCVVSLDAGNADHPAALDAGESDAAFDAE